MNRHDELEADLAQYYHLDIERMGDEFSHAHAACLASQLPKGARCRVADDPHEAWGAQEWILRRIAHDMAVLRWCFAKYDGEPQPSPLPYPGEGLDKEMEGIRLRMNKESVDKAFNMTDGGEDGD